MDGYEVWSEGVTQTLVFRAVLEALDTVRHDLIEEVHDAEMEQREPFPGGQLEPVSDLEWVPALDRFDGELDVVHVAFGVQYDFYGWKTYSDLLTGPPTELEHRFGVSGGGPYDPDDPDGDEDYRTVGRLTAYTCVTNFPGIADVRVYYYYVEVDD